MSNTATRPSSVSFLFDRANLITLGGLLCGVTSLYCSARGETVLAVILLLWALLCDWTDGLVARRMPNRTEVDRQIGGQLDSLADLVSSGVGPAMLLLAVSGWNPWFLPGAGILVGAGALRLAHFNVFGHDGGSFSGLPIDTNIIVVTAVFAFRDIAGHAVFPWILYGTVLSLAALNLGPFRSPKLVGNWYYGITAYVVGMTALYVQYL